MSLVSAKVPVCGVTPPTLCQTHLHRIQRLNPICIPEEPMTSPKRLWPLCFSTGWMHCTFTLTCDQSNGFFIMAREADCQSVWNKTAFRSVKETYWHGTIQLIKSEGGFISSSVIVFAAFCRNNYDDFCMPSEYITICMRFTSTESKRKESAKKLEAFQSRWASRDILIQLNFTKLCYYTKSGDRN